MPSRLPCLVAALAVLASPAAASAAGGSAYVVRALGDSVAAGFGLGESLPAVIACNRKLPTTSCDHPDRAFPALVAAALTPAEREGRPLDFRNLAIAGAEPAMLVGGGKLTGYADAAVAADPDVLIVTLGANDLLTDPRCGVQRACARRLLARLRTRATIRRLLERLAQQTDARIYLTQYYRYAFDHGGGTEELNRTLTAAAAGLRDVTVVPAPSFKDHGCFAPEAIRWVLHLFQDACMHPNLTGHRQMATALLRALRADRATKSRS